MVQHLSGDGYVNAYCKGTGIHVRRVVLKAIRLITSFQDTHLVKEMLTLILICKLCVENVIQAKGGGFLAET
jgi:hypothetical protein